MNAPFTGRHMAAILVLFFSVVFAVNFTMARYASSTFGGIVVENSYVASQEFNTWLDEASAEKALGWKATVERTTDGRLAIDLSGAPADVTLTAIARHPLGRAPDRAITFTSVGDGRFLSIEELPLGRWTLRIEARTGQSVWRDEEHLT
ncbi:hypothetical protein MB02_04380 [Croceicoccus estronivorus]|uniref:FixH family protein n=1 Tax=Croceicoccus estronivorus TaxID=1172626 RepID=UPI00082AD58B|nr:FixH family protein [Croceicoccus estronivorus]OCC24720.1 hypothetical protein MB02_04380 [Croceicoccus estronivorus]